MLERLILVGGWALFMYLLVLTIAVVGDLIVKSLIKKRKRELKRNGSTFIRREARN